MNNLDLYFKPWYRSLESDCGLIYCLSTCNNIVLAQIWKVERTQPYWRWCISIGRLVSGTCDTLEIGFAKVEDVIIRNHPKYSFIDSKLSALI